MNVPEYDVVVIGGGIHGCGIAQATAAAGYRALLLEQTAVASATSSSSSKLIHGGLRYLESAQFPLVRESLRERATLLRIAPELVRLVPFHIPVYKTTTRRPWQIRAGLSLYALLGGFGGDARFHTLPRREWDELDGLTTRDLVAVFCYQDGLTDDAALTRAVMRSAQSLGAELACPALFLRAQRHAEGYTVQYTHRRAEMECRCRVLLNAAGPWVNQVLEKISPAPPALPIELVQGAHILVKNKIRRGVYYIEAPWDRRAVFVIPWRGNALVGTTETKRTGGPDYVQALPEEINYLRKTLRRYFPDAQSEVMDSFAGLRVLPAGSGTIFHRPRETILMRDNDREPRMVTVYGGKLTGYRATAEQVLGLLRRCLPARKPRADTAQLMLSP